MLKNKLTHHSLFYKKEFPTMYTPTPFRTAITAPKFFYERWWDWLKGLIPKKEKTEPDKKDV